MHVLVGIVGGLVILLVLAEFFVAFPLPRRVKRDPRIVASSMRSRLLP